MKEIDHSLGVGANIGLPMLPFAGERETVHSRAKAFPHRNIRVSASKEHHPLVLRSAFLFTRPRILDRSCLLDEPLRGIGRRVINNGFQKLP